MKALDDQERDRANLLTSTISSVAEAYFTSQGAKGIQFGAFNPIATYNKVLEAKEICKPRTARIFLRLLKEGEIPSWVTREVDLKMIQLAGS